KKAADADSDGWPQTGRNKALREMQRGFAFHISGDQHLGSTVQYGVEDWNDAAYALCVPSIANLWPRRWWPPEPGRNRKPNSPAYTGEFKDGFGNRITVHAVSNPGESGYQPAALYDRAPGYGIVRVNRLTRQITFEVWPRWVDPSQPAAKQYPGWPITADQAENYGRKAVAYLPTIKVSGMANPVVQIVDEENGEIVYTLRIRGTEFRPKVFKDGTYTVKVGEPGTERMKTLKNVRALPESETSRVEVVF
ncbi:twin-arginine translocation pathway signal protein, partial [candidate division BRC1 bacterium SM23_51]